MNRWIRFTVFPVAAAAAAPTASATVLLSQEEALKAAFPAGCRVERKTAFLTDAQQKELRRLGGGSSSALVVYYRGMRANGELAGTAIFDTHIVRTQPETLMVLISPSGTISRIEVLSFSEPKEYLPTPHWYAQFPGKALDENLYFNRGIRPVTGATLTARVTIDAARRSLALVKILAPSP